VNAAQPDRIATGSLFAVLLFSFAYFYGGSGFNQNATFDLTRAIVEHRELHIDRYAANTADISRYGGHIYSNKVPGLSFLAVIPYAPLYALRGAPENALELNLYLYVTSIVTAGISGALIGVLLYKAARHRGLSPDAAYAIALVVALGTPIFAYSTMLFPHVPASLFALLAFLALDGTLRRNALLAGAAVGAAVLMHYLCALLVFVMLGFLLATSRARIRETLRYIAGGMPFAAVLGWYQYAVFGSPFQTTIPTVNPGFLSEDAWFGIFYLPRAEALWGLTFSPYRGLFYLAPVMLLAVIGLVAMFRKERAAAMTIVAGALLFFIINSAFNGWHGSYTIGPRYSLPAVPLLAIGLVYIHGRFRLVYAVLAAISLFFNFAVTAVDPQVPDKFHDPVTKYVIPALLTGRAANDPTVPPWLGELYTGHTSTNRVAADELMPFQRHRPGSPESEWASFNLGELLFGPGSFASILPYLAIVAAAVLTTRASLRRRYRATHTTPDTQTERSRSA